jgi:hypothetical protein
MCFGTIDNIFKLDKLVSILLIFRICLYFIYISLILLKIIEKIVVVRKIIKIIYREYIYIYIY